MSAQDRPNGDSMNLLFERIRNTLGESASQRLQPALASFFEQFQLVSKQSLDTHLNVLANLEQTVAELEARIQALESQPPPS